MKAYILSENDFLRLLAEIDRDPQYGFDGGSSTPMNEEQQKMNHEAHSFYNYRIRRWIDSVKKD